MESDSEQHGNGGGEGEKAWLDRHLGKVIAAALAVCLLALVGRALTG